MRKISLFIAMSLDGYIADNKGIPVLFGSGIRLFENAKHEIKLKLLNTRSYNGMTDLIYTRR